MPRSPAVSFTRRRATLALFGAALALALPSAASASEVSISGANQLFLTGAPGENNDVELHESAGNLIVNDTAGVTANAGCMPVNATRATCPLAAFNTAFVHLDDGANTVDADQDHHIYIDGPSATTNHFVSSSAGGSSLIGGDGPDYLSTPSGDGNHLVGNGGKDRLFGGSGDDELEGGDGDDTIQPGIGDDEIFGDADADTVDYSERLAQLHLTLNNNIKNDGAAGEHDNIHDDIERVIGGFGPDVIGGSSGRDTIEGRNGHDTIDGGGGNDDLFGGEGNDTLKGASGIDFVSGGDDQDTIDGGGEGDLLVGGLGNDVVDGALGDDQLTGDGGTDQLLGGIGDDELRGDAGADNLIGGQGADELMGGADDDTVDYSANAAPITVDLDGSTYDDGAESEGDSVAADVENVTGGTGPDKLTGNAGQNVLIGAQGDDTIDGGDNNDTLIGASGADTLLSKDGVLDIVDCGIDTDVFDSDPIDTLIDCESPAINQDMEQPKEDMKDDEKVDPLKPALRIGAASRVSRTRFVKLSVSCPKSASGPCTGTLRLQRSVKGKVKTFGKKGFKVQAGSKAKVKIKVSKKTAKSIARKPLRVNAVGKATAGASDTSRKVTLKPAAKRKR